MSDKPATHAMIELLPNQVALGNNEVTLAILSPDDAVALGYAVQ